MGNAISIGMILQDVGTILFVRQYESGVCHFEVVKYVDRGGVWVDEWWDDSLRKNDDDGSEVIEV